MCHVTRATRKRATTNTTLQRIAQFYRRPEMREQFGKWGREGGLKRKDKLTAESRKKIARKAARARWAKRKKAKARAR